MRHTLLNNKLLAILYIIALLFCAPLLAQSEESAARLWLEEVDTLRIAINQNLPPFSFLDEKGNPKGFAVDIAAEICEKLDAEIDFIVVDFETASLDSINKKCDLLIGVFRNSSYNEDWVLSNTILECQFSFYCREGDCDIEDLSDLCDRTVGLHPYSPAADLIEATCKESYLSRLSPQGALNKVDTGELDIAVLPTMVADHVILEMALDDRVEKAPSLMLKFDCVIAVPADKAFILGKLDSAINKIKREGSLKALRDKWLFKIKEDEEHIGGFVYLVIVLIVLMGMLLFYIAAKIRNFNISMEAERKKIETLENELDDLKKEFVSLEQAASSGDVGFFALRDEEGIMGRFVYVNEGLEKITGYSFEQLHQKSFVELFEGEDLEKVLERYKLRRQGEDLPELYEVYGIRSDGERRPIELSVRVAKLSDGLLTVGILKDISREKALQKKLRESDQNFRSMLSSMPNGAIVMNKQRILYINNAFRRIVGRSPEWIRSSGISRLLPPVHRARIEALISNLIEGREAPKEIQFELMGPEDNLIMLNARPRAVSYFGEKAVLFIVDRKTPGKEISAGAARPSASFAKVAEDLVLDYNNSIMGIVGAVNRLATMTKENEDEREFTAIIEKETERLSELTGKLLSIIKETDEKTGRVISLHAVIQDALELLPKPPSGVLSIKTFLNARPDTLRGNLSQVHQIVLNLMVNAVESMPEGGELTIVTGNSSYESPYIINDESIKPGRYVWIKVQDNGPGISPHELENIFRPFSRAGHIGAGMGLGLSLVQKLVRKHDGHIEVESEERVGTTFTVYFPEELPLEEKSTGVTQLPHGDETILVVDDEPHVRTVLKSMLEYLGYEVLLASDGAEATEIMRSRGKDIDLVLLDIIMPEMGGEEAFRNIKNIQPDVSVIISTGYAHDQTLSNLLQQGADALIRKPYAVGTISRVVREALDRED